MERKISDLNVFEQNPSRFDHGKVGSFFGSHIPVAEKFYNTTCLPANVGLFFHDPMGYPNGKLGGWERVCAVPADVVWHWVRTVAPGGDFWASDTNGNACPFGYKKFWEVVADFDANAHWHKNMALVVEVQDEHILAIYRDPEQEASWYVIRLRP